jgi:hypothetical protein
MIKMLRIYSKGFLENVTIEELIPHLYPTIIWATTREELTLRPFR